MGASRARAGPELVTGGVMGRTRPGVSAAAALDFAGAQILRDDTALGALPAVLGHLRTVRAERGAGLSAEVASSADGKQGRCWRLGPRGARPDAVDPGLLARIGALTLAQREGAAASQHEGAAAESRAAAARARRP